MQSPGQRPPHGTVPAPLARLRADLTSGEAVVAGVLSGTSADGIDVAIVRFDGARLPPSPLAAPRALAFETRPFPAELAEPLRALLDGRARPDLGQLARLDRDLGLAFGAAAREVARAHGVALALAASHGQTAWHHDGAAGGGATLQLGDGCFAAEAAGCPVASDFRQADLAAGGEGAPVSARADELVFAAAPRPTLVLNLGGMANVTRLPAAGEPLLAFDVGPCGSLLDGLARRLLGAPLDRDGAAAARGRVRGELLSAWAGHPFFALPPPKSTGRDTFGEAWIDGLLDGLDAPREDVLRTAVELVATTVADALERFASPAGPLVLCGGGAHHPGLVQALGERCGAPPISSAEVGVDPDAREALVFAVLGARCVLGLPSTRPEATGARSGRVLGKLSLGSAQAGAP